MRTDALVNELRCSNEKLAYKLPKMVAALRTWGKITWPFPTALSHAAAYSPLGPWESREAGAREAGHQFNLLSLGKVASGHTRSGSASGEGNLPPLRWGSAPPVRKLRRERSNFWWDGELRRKDSVVQREVPEIAWLFN